MAERATLAVKKAEQGLDYSVAAVSYYTGDHEDSIPQLIAPNETLGRPVRLRDNPELVLSWEHVAEERQIDCGRTLEFDIDGNLVGIVFENSKNGVTFEGLPLPDEVVSLTRDLIAAYHEDTKEG